MILVILGTHTQPFDRLAEGIDSYAATTDEEIVVQMGVSNYPMQHVAKHFAYCTKDEMNGYMEQADLLVMQGGWGGMEEAIDLGKRIVASYAILFTSSTRLPARKFSPSRLASS